MKKNILLICFLSICSCNTNRNTIADQKGSEIRSFVKVGDNIFNANRLLKKRGYTISNPYFPTDMKEEYWMDVGYGLSQTTLEQIHYGLNTPTIPSRINSKRISGTIKATPSGKIYKIE